MRRKIYGLMMVGMMLLMAGCSTDDVVKETTSAEGIAISFSCNYDDQEEHPTRAGHQGVMNTEDLYATGFGVMASVSADEKPDLMYNQKVEFTFVGDMADPLKGYWSYSPLKYWPTSMTNFYISAYAPYVDAAYLGSLTPAQLADETGIYGISANSEAPYIDYRRCDKPNQLVDLLWYYVEPTAIPAKTAQKEAGILDMKMRHALARLEIKVALASDVELDAGTKVLIEKITLTGQMAKTGRLHLYEQETVIENPDTEDEVTRYYPIWSGQTYDLDHSIQIKNVDNDDASYGIIDSQVRYIEGMPYSWQPAGLKVYDAEKEDKNFLNALSTGDRTGYVYLIPQDVQNLTVSVRYHQMTSGNDKKTTATISPIRIPTPTEAVPNPKFKGNTTYTLNLTLKKIVDP